ncbi:MAG: CHAT domain-containing protein [Cyanobacteria bacterium J06597_1]
MIATALMFSLLASIVWLPTSPFHVNSQSASAQVDIGQLVKTAQDDYRANRFQNALSAWEQAATAFEEQGDLLNQSMALTNLSLSAQQLGYWPEANNSVQEGIDILRLSDENPDQQRVLANALNTQALLQFSTGRSRYALALWQETETIYRKLGNTDRAIASQINQARAQQSLGLYSSACINLLDVLGEDSDRCQLPDPETLASAESSSTELPPSSRLQALLNLGTMLRVTGQLRSSYDLLLAMGPLVEPSESSILGDQWAIALGNTAQALGIRRANQLTPRREQSEAVSQSPTSCAEPLDATEPAVYFRQADLCFQQAANSASNLEAVQARLNQAALAARTDTTTSSPSQLEQLQADIDRLPNSSAAITARLNLIQTGMCIQSREADIVHSPLLQDCQPYTEPLDPSTDTGNQPPISWGELRSFAEIARDRARDLGDPVSESYALGYMGAIALQMGDETRATQLTTQALQQITAFDVPSAAYLWQWQLGRIYRQEEDRARALSAYRLAVSTLDGLRTDLVAVSPEIQFNFRDSVEPVYREYVDLLLQPENPTQAELQQARSAIESLQLAELNDYFREACETQQEQAIDAIDSKAGVFYSILLPERLAVILSVANQPLVFYSTDFDRTPNGTGQGTAVVERTFEQLMAQLNPAYFSPDPLQPHQQLYDWLIRPAETLLEDNDIETLVFVLDGYLRGIPVAALHDGDRYLVERYAVALTPGLQLLDADVLALENINVLAGGVAESRQGFASLPGVKQEVAKIAELAPTDVFLDGDFTRLQFQERVKTATYPLVHIASHAQLSSRSEDTFLITWNDRINVKELDSLLLSRRDRPIEMLVLSACQTAVGDNRAALGLAGMAVRSGARSTVATLWAVQDASTADAIGEFYTVLKQGNTSKAKALQQAQLALLHSSEYSHPFYWAPFVLVGNWL